MDSKVTGALTPHSLKEQGKPRHMKVIWRYSVLYPKEDVTVMIKARDEEELGEKIYDYGVRYDLDPTRARVIDIETGGFA